MNLPLKLLLMGSYLWVFGEGLLGPLYAIFAEDVGGSVLELTGAYAIYLVIAGILMIVVGRVADRGRSELLMMAGYALNAAATFGYLLVKTPAHLFIVQAILGIALALANPTWDSLFQKYSEEGSVATAWGLEEGGNFIAQGAAMMLGGIILTATSFTALFVIMGVVQTIATVVQATILLPRTESL